MSIHSAREKRHKRFWLVPSQKPAAGNRNIAGTFVLAGCRVLTAVAFIHFAGMGCADGADELFLAKDKTSGSEIIIARDAAPSLRASGEYIPPRNTLSLSRAEMRQNSVLFS